MALARSFSRGAAALCIAVPLVTGCLPTVPGAGAGARARPQVPVGRVVAGQTAWTAQRIEFSTRAWKLPHNVVDSRPRACGAGCRRMVVNATPHGPTGYCVHDGFLYVASEHLARVRLQDGHVDELYLPDAPDVLYTTVACDNQGPLVAMHQPSSVDNPTAIMQFEGSTLIAYRVWQAGPTEQNLEQIKTTRPLTSVFASEQVIAFDGFPAGNGPGLWVIGPGDQPARRIAPVFEHATVTVSGDRVAWESGRDIWTWTPSAARPVNLTASEETDELSPWIDGNRVAFVRKYDSSHRDPTDVLVYDIPTRGTRVVSHDPPDLPRTERDVSIGGDWLVWSSQGPLVHEDQGTHASVPEIRGVRLNGSSDEEVVLAKGGGTAPTLSTVWAPRVLEGKLYYAATEIAPLEDGRPVIFYSVYEQTLPAE